MSARELNLHGGWSLIKGTWLSWMQQRGFFFVLAFGWMIVPLITLFVWSTAAEGKTISGFTQSEFVSYYLLFIVANQFTYAVSNWTVGDVIRSGSFNFVLLRPLPPLFQALATDIAGKVVCMTFVMPVSVILIAVLHPVLHLTLFNALVFVPTLIMAWLLRFFWGYWMALLAFWANQAEALLAVQESAIFLFAGQVAPVALLPNFLQICAKILPFRYMIGFPVEVLTGHLTSSEVVIGVLFQVNWLVITLFICMFVWRRGLRRYAAIGG